MHCGCRGADCNFGFDEKFKPILRFRCFLLDNPEFVYEIGARNGAICFAIIGADRRS